MLAACAGKHLLEMRSISVRAVAASKNQNRQATNVFELRDLPSLQTKGAQASLTPIEPTFNITECRFYI